MDNRYSYRFCSKKNRKVIGLPTQHGGHDGRIAFPDRESATKGWAIARQTDKGKTRKDHIRNVAEAVKSIGGRLVHNLADYRRFGWVVLDRNDAKGD